MSAMRVEVDLTLRQANLRMEPTRRPVWVFMAQRRAAHSDR